MSQVRYLVALLLMLAVCGGAAGVTLAEVVRSDSSGSVYATQRSVPFRATRVIRRVPTVVDALSFRGHGGIAELEWYCGAIASLGQRARADLAMDIDHRQLVDTQLSGSGGTYDARATLLRWIGRVSPGRHLLTVVLRRATSPVAVPVVVTGSTPGERLSVVERTS